MAVTKEYNVAFAVATQKMYTQKGATQTPIIANAQGAYKSSNPYNNVELGRVGGPGSTKWKLEIHRKLRQKSHAADKSVAIGDQIIARLNAATKQDWTSLPAFPTEKRDFLVYVEEGDQENFSSNPADFSSGIEQAAEVIMIEDEETAIDMIVKSITADPTLWKKMASDFSDLEVAGEELFQELLLDVQRIGLFVDAYAHFTGVSAYVHPLGAAAMRIYKGSAFHVSTSAYADQLLPDFETDGLSAGYTDPHFNKVVFNDGTDDLRLIWLSLGDDSFFDGGYANQMRSLDSHFLDIDFNGHSYYKCQAIVDPKRMRAGFAKISDTILAASNKVGA